MPQFLLQRLVAFVATLVAASLVVFLVLEVLPGDPALVMLGTEALPETLAALRATGRIDEAVYGAGLGLPEEDIRPAAELDPGERGPYLATLIVPPKRTGRGGAL